MAKIGKLPDREQIIRRMWKLANAEAGDAVKLACFPPEIYTLSLHDALPICRGWTGWTWTP